MNTYWADVRFVDREPIEHSMELDYLSGSDADAVRDAARFAANRERALERWTFSSISVGYFEASSIRPDGILIPAHRGRFFEWKCDWGETLEQRIHDRLED